MSFDSDIVFDKEGIRFKYRIAGVGLNNGRVLLQQINGEDFWYLPGGAGILGEEARDTLMREMREELDAVVDVGRLVWISEDFHKFDSRFFHEVSLFFLVNFAKDSSILKVDEIQGTDQGAGSDLVSVTNKWHNLDGLKDMVVVPPFLKAGLCSIPAATEHLVNRER